MTKLCKSWREPQGISVLCFVPVQRQSETPPRSLRLDCHRAVDLPIKVLKSHAKTEYLLRMALSQCHVCWEHSVLLYPCAVVFPYSLWRSRSKVLSVVIKVTWFSCSCPRLVVRKWILRSGCLRQTSEIGTTKDSVCRQFQLGMVLKKTYECWKWPLNSDGLEDANLVKTNNLPSVLFLLLLSPPSFC